MQNLYNIRVIKNLLQKHNFKFSKSLGQNFIINNFICPKMTEYSIENENTGVLEIGPGFGILTCELAKKAKKVVALEIDKSTLPVLKETLSEFSNVKIINVDALKADIKKIIKEEFSGMNVVVCANLPYYVTSPILMKLLEENLPIDSITVMVQKEVADRICAGPGKRECGAISVVINYFSKPEFLFTVKKGNFMPMPKVDSAVIKLDLLNKPKFEKVNEKNLFFIIKSLFKFRRKTILNSLNAAFNIPKETILEKLEILDLNPNSRPENLSLKDFVLLSNLF